MTSGSAAGAARGASAWPAYDAVVLAGGASTRMGGIDKTLLDVGGLPLLARVIAAVASARQVVVVGPRRSVPLPDPAPTLIWIREEPTGGGPAAALAAGLHAVTSDAVVVLAADLPFVTVGTVHRLLAARQERDGAILVDADGYDQHLVGAWSAPALRAALSAPSPADLAGRGLHPLLRPLDVIRLRGGNEADDCDSPADLARARERMRDVSVLDEWTADVSEALGLDLGAVDRDLVLDLTRDVAHDVARPAAPLTAFLVGLAAGRSGGTAADVRAAAEAVLRLVAARRDRPQ